MKDMVVVVVVEGVGLEEEEDAPVVMEGVEMVVVVGVEVVAEAEEGVEVVVEAAERVQELVETRNGRLIFFNRHNIIVNDIQYLLVYGTKSFEKVEHKSPLRIYSHLKCKFFLYCFIKIILCIF